MCAEDLMFLISRRQRDKSRRAPDRRRSAVRRAWDYLVAGPDESDRSARGGAYAGGYWDMWELALRQGEKRMALRDGRPRGQDVVARRAPVRRTRRPVAKKHR